MDIVLESIGEELINGIARPIDVLLLQEQSSMSLTGQAFVDLLNGIYGPGTYARSFVNGATSEPNGDAGRPGLVYNTTTVQLVEEVVASAPSTARTRPAPRCAIALKPVGYDDSAIFWAYNDHYKAGNTATDQTRRNIEATNIRTGTFYGSDAAGRRCPCDLCRRLQHAEQLASRLSNAHRGRARAGQRSDQPPGNLEQQFQLRRRPHAGALQFGLRGRPDRRRHGRSLRFAARDRRIPRRRRAEHTLPARTIRSATTAPRSTRTSTTPATLILFSGVTSIHQVANPRRALARDRPHPGRGRLPASGHPGGRGGHGSGHARRRPGVQPRVVTVSNDAPCRWRPSGPMSWIIRSPLPATSSMAVLDRSRFGSGAGRRQHALS